MLVAQGGAAATSRAPSGASMRAATLCHKSSPAIAGGQSCINAPPKASISATCWRHMGHKLRWAATASDHPSAKLPRA